MTSININDIISLKDTQLQKKKLMEVFEINAANADYFIAIFKQLNQSEKSISITEDQNQNGYFPLALASKDQLQEFNIFSFTELKSKKHKHYDGPIYYMPLMAGIGSSIKRESHLRQNSGRISLGTKSTDLFVQSTKSSIFDLLVKQIESLNKQDHRDIIFYPQMSDDTFELIKELTRIKGPRSTIINNEITQNRLPTLMGDDLVDQQTAPGGHGFFAYTWINNLLKNSPQGISVIGNGEDLNSLPPLEIIDWFSQQDFPILMITTTKTSIDKKGGQICLFNENDQSSLSIIEKAQAEQSGQLELFSELGLRKNDGPSFFNTNTVLINNDLLRKKLELLGKDGNEINLQDVISPQLIKNKKKNSKSEEFTQLEGAMGSVVLHLNREFKKAKNESLLGILNVEPIDRFKVFCPIKSAFDFVHKFYSDRFSLKEFRLVDENPGLQTEVSLMDPSGTIDYDDVNSCMSLFRNTSLKELSQLKVKGPVDFEGIKLIGSIKIENETSKCQKLKELFRDGKLSNCTLKIKATEDGIEVTNE